MIADEYNVSIIAEKSYNKLTDFIEDKKISKRLFRRTYLNKNIFVNEKFRRKDFPIIKGDIIRIFMPQE